MSNHTKKQLSGYELKVAIYNTINYMSKSFISSKELINQSDIVQECFKDNEESFDMIMERATEYFKIIYNYKIVEVETYAKLPQGRQYFPIFIEKVGGLWRSLALNENQRNYVLLLSFTLTHIAGTGGRCPEGTLWAFFKGLNISLEKMHSRFGNIKERVLNEFTKDLYIDTLPAPDGVFLLWGFRAYEEFDREFINVFILAAINGKPGTTVKQVFQSASRMAFKPDITLL